MTALVAIAVIFLFACLCVLCAILDALLKIRMRLESFFIFKLEAREEKRPAEVVQ